MLPLIVENLRFTGQHDPIIKGVNFSLNDAGVTVVMGPNGAGKSVLLRLLHGLLKVNSGQILWNGTGLNEALRKRQSLLFQRPVLLRRSVLANLRFVLKQRHISADDETCLNLLSRVQLDHVAYRSARHLSGGEQQRLALARSLALKPEVLLMDEPAASLDPVSTKMIETIVRDQRANNTKVIFVTHDVSQAHRVADDVLFLHHGEVLEHTSASTFFEQPQSTQARQYLSGEIVV